MDTKKESIHDGKASVDGDTAPVPTESSPGDMTEQTSTTNSQELVGDSEKEMSHVTFEQSEEEQSTQAGVDGEIGEDAIHTPEQPGEKTAKTESTEAETEAVSKPKDAAVTGEEDVMHEQVEDETTGELMGEASDEVIDEGDVERSQLSSGSEDEDVRNTRNLALQRMQTVMTKPSGIQNPNTPRKIKEEDKQLMEEGKRLIRDKAILQSMAVAERGYITRLRPPSVPTDKLTLSQYQIRPGLEEKFKSQVVKELIHTVLNDELGGKTYAEEDAKIWSQSIANTIRMKVKEMGFPRYKFVVQCVIGEEHGAGVKIGSRCLWDADTDNYASDSFLNETIFCMTAVYAIYFY